MPNRARMARVVLALAACLPAAAAAQQPVVKIPAAFERRCIPPDRVVRRLRMPNMRPPHALSAGRLAALGATRDFTTGCQTPLLGGYVQTVPAVSAGAGPADSNLSQFSRFRLSAEPAFGPLRIEAAYEHLVTLRRRDSPLGFGAAILPGGGEWLDLQWTAAEDDHAVWRHRFDRLSVGWAPAGRFEITAGRQAVSWGTTLLLSPADPFTPFNPADPFREFLAGVDAARVRVHPGPFSEIDVVLRQSESPLGVESTVLARGLATVRRWEISGWGGALHGDPAVAFGAAGALAGWAVRGEAMLRRRGEAAVFRGALGVDRQFQVGGRDLLIAAEYQRDGLGAAGPAEYAAVLRSDTFRRGEHQVLGRDETVVQASYQAHPLWSFAGLWLWNLRDRSALLSPSFAYSAGDDASISAGVFVGVGDADAAPARPLPSEYGLAGVTGYAALSWFF